jgi:predicted nuclease of restriction endonuclease-like (RecB) superfamily
VHSRTPPALHAELRGLILATRAQVTQAVNSGLTLLYWQIGDRIRREVLREKRAAYGEEIVPTASAQLGWSHFGLLLAVNDSLTREFYTEMCRVEHWSVRTLRTKIDSQLFLRTALSKKPEKLARQELAALREQDRLSPDLVFRNPYVLDFLGLKNSYAEKDLEAAILREMEAFILELGVGSPLSNGRSV